MCDVNGGFPTFQYSDVIGEMFHLTGSWQAVHDMKLQEMKKGPAVLQDGGRYRSEVKLGAVSFVGMADSYGSAREKAIDKLYHHLICTGDPRLVKIPLFRRMRDDGVSRNVYVHKMVRPIYSMRVKPNCSQLPQSLLSDNIGGQRETQYAPATINNRDFVGKGQYYNDARLDVYEKVLKVEMGVDPYAPPPPELHSLFPEGVHVAAPAPAPCVQDQAHGAAQAPAPWVLPEELRLRVVYGVHDIDRFRAFLEASRATGEMSEEQILEAGLLEQQRLRAGAGRTSPTTAGAAAVQPVARQIITGPPDATPIGGIAAGVQDQGAAQVTARVSGGMYEGGRYPTSTQGRGVDVGVRAAANRNRPASYRPRVPNNERQCWRWADTGRCSYGRRCKFQHY